MTTTSLPPLTRRANPATSGQLLVAGMLAAAFYVVGYLLSGFVPGGGTTADQTVTDFYDGNGPGTAFVLFFGLLAASICLVWFFTVLVDQLGESLWAKVGLRLAMMGAGLLVAGGAIMLAPSAALKISDATFVGVPTAVAFAQAGLGVTVIGGVWLLAVAIIVLSLGGRRLDGYPGWLAWSGVILGVLALGSVIWAPGLLLAVWFVLAAVGAGRSSPTG